MGHRVVVLTLKLHSSLPNREIIAGVEVIRVPGFAPSNAYFAPDLRFIERIIKAIKLFDIVHVHNLGSLITPTVIALHRALGASPKLVLSPHHHEAGSRVDTRIAWILYKPLIKRVIESVDTVHTVSIFEAKLLKRDFDINSITVPNGIREDVYSYRWSPPDKATVTYAGRVEAYKRVDLLVKIIARAQQILGKRIRLRVIGDGPRMPRVRKLAASLGVELEHTGFLPRREYLKNIAETNVFSNISRYEAYSIVTAEALAMGVPTVVARPWGLNFLPYGVTVVDPQDIDRTARIIVDIIDGTLNPPKAKLPTWREIANLYTSKLYG